MQHSYLGIWTNCKLVPHAAPMAIAKHINNVVVWRMYELNTVNSKHNYDKSDIGTKQI